MRDDRLYLEDIIASIEAIQAFVAGKSREEFESNKLLQSAVLHELSIIGEAAARISETLRESTPNLPWREICGFRNQIVHAYFSLDLDIVWETVSGDLPELRKSIEDKLRELSRPDR